MAAEQQTIDTQKKTCIYHPETQTKFTCGKCNEPICTKCVVFCEVGVKCKQCVSGFKNHMVIAEPKDYIIAGISSIAVGFAFGFGLLALRYELFWACLLGFFGSRWVGQQVHRLARNKINVSMQLVVIGCGVIGIFISPYFDEVLKWTIIEWGSETMGYGFLYDWLPAIIWIFAYQMPFMPYRRR